MTSNRDRAAEIIYAVEKDSEVGIVDVPAMVDRLADSGLITPNLPAPTMTGGLPTWRTPGQDGDHGALVHLVDTQVVLMLDDGTKQAIVSTRDEARNLALALLAAAAHAQKEDSHDQDD